MAKASVRRIDLAGQVFGRLSVLRYSHTTPRGGAMWLCRCACGKEKPVLAGNLRSGRSTSCGCLTVEAMRAVISPDLIGQTFDRLTVVSRASINTRRVRWNCVCQCGNTTIAHTTALTRGHKRSCGCLAKDANGKRTHGMSESSEYKLWQKMVKRASDRSTGRDRRCYFGRGIRVCEHWLNFANFYADMGPRPSPKHTIERKDNDGDYCPENCVWATRLVQARNQRTNRRLTFQGRTMCVAEWEESLGFKNGTVRNRLHHGWSVERALTTEVRPQPSQSPCPT